MLKLALLLLSGASRFALGQFLHPEGVKVVAGAEPGVLISYKETKICETTPGVRSYAGYVHLPPGISNDRGEPTDWPINTFFWFFESRKDPANAPTSVWLNGGPGTSSMLGLLAENGPCHINPDSNSTRLNEWSWNNEANMLYIDQPVQVGFSYDRLTNITKNLITGEVIVLNATDPIPEQNSTFLVGTYGSQNADQSSHGSVNGAAALWHFAQSWFQEFPEYKPNDDRLSLTAESYGGRYGPAMFAYFQEQNELIQNGTLSDEEYAILELDTLIFVNSCIDRLVQWPSYIQLVRNNTYGLELVNATVQEQMSDALYREGGCNDQIYACRNASIAFDPENTGINSTVNDVCREAESFCSDNVRSPYLKYSGRNYYDFGALEPSSFPYLFYQGYLQQPHVQAALGVPLNFSQNSPAAASAVRSIGDYIRPGWLEDLSDLLDSGVKVALMYGDRDYACNWIGGEAISLAINYTNTAEFHAAGYTAIQTNDTYSGGQVRQYGNLSFNRVYQAGHEVPAYAPETAYRIFTRTLGNVDTATGKIPIISSDEGDKVYSSEGSVDTWAIRNDPPEQRLQWCYLFDVRTCTEEQIERIQNGTAVLQNYIYVDGNSTKLFPELLGVGGNETKGSGGSSPSSPAKTGSATGLKPFGGLALGLSLIVAAAESFL